MLSLLFLAPPMLAAQEDADDGRTLYWTEFAVEAHLDSDGLLHVEEWQAMVFDGAWNGAERAFNLGLGQQLRFHSLTRMDPATGSQSAVIPGDLEGVDEFDWGDGETLRWRSRIESDPPFQDREIVYHLDYTIAPVLFRTNDGEYRLQHDFAIKERAGVIEYFHVDLTLDSAWVAPGGARIQRSAEQLSPGEGYTIDLTLRYVGPGEPAAVPTGAPAWIRALTAGGALILPLLLFVGLRRRGRELERVAPLTAPADIDEDWLRSRIFSQPAEIVGTAWDRSVGEAEVAALLARLVEEEKLTSRVDTEGKDPVLHLRRIAPLSDFPEHERALLEGLFFDGGEETDTAAVRKYYEGKGFDPAATIREALTARLDDLPGAGRVKRTWLPAAAVVLLGAVIVFLPAPPGGLTIGILGVIIAVFGGAFAIGFGALLARRVTHRTGPTVGVLLPLVIPALLLVLLASGVFERAGGLAFYRPGTSLLLGFVVIFVGVALMALALARPTETVERLAFRRQLVSAREFFESELDRPQPRLQDAWFPYLLAFGLGSHIDRWFSAFGGRDVAGSTGALLVATGTLSGGHSGGGWSGGGPQFGGGGGFGGGGAGGSWGVAAAGMAAGVSAPSSSGGGGVAASGGGGGGGW